MNRNLGIVQPFNIFSLLALVSPISKEKLQMSSDEQKCKCEKHLLGSAPFCAKEIGSVYTRNYLFSPLIDSVTLHSRMNPGQPDVII